MSFHRIGIDRATRVIIYQIGRQHAGARESHLFLFTQNIRKS